MFTERCCAKEAVRVSHTRGRRCQRRAPGGVGPREAQGREGGRKGVRGVPLPTFVKTTPARDEAGVADEVVVVLRDADGDDVGLVVDRLVKPSGEKRANLFGVSSGRKACPRPQASTCLYS